MTTTTKAREDFTPWANPGHTLPRVPAYVSTTTGWGGATVWFCENCTEYVDENDIVAHLEAEHDSDDEVWPAEPVDNPREDEKGTQVCRRCECWWDGVKGFITVRTWCRCNGDCDCHEDVYTHTYPHPTPQGHTWNCGFPECPGYYKRPENMRLMTEVKAQQEVEAARWAAEDRIDEEAKGRL